MDLMIPGGGVGAFDACSSQWSVSTSALGERYGGLLATCRNQNPGAALSVIKSCVLSKCEAIFSGSFKAELMEGCRWFVNWFEAANNPAVNYKQVTCPSAITSRSGMSH